MRHSQTEKMEIIRIVEQSHLPIKHTLKELDIASSTFYNWYQRFQIYGYDGLADKSSRPGRIWNRIPDKERERVVQIALEYPVSAVIFVPNDHKSSTILRGRFEAGELSNQIVVPTKVVENLLQSIFKIKQIFDTVFLLVGFATLLILGLIVTLSLRLRREEIYTMFTIGSSRAKVFEILTFELIMLITLSTTLTLIMYYITGYFVDDFMRAYIL